VAEAGRGPGHQDQVRPGPGVGLGDSRPDPPACAGDEGNIPVKPERVGLLIRTVYPTVPPKVEYSLTAIARELSESFATLTAWAEQHRHAIAASRRKYDGQRAPPASLKASA
jgi:hypothetical protein